MPEHPKRPLKIYHSECYGVHQFWTNKINFELDELKQASIIERTETSLLAVEHSIQDNGLRFTIRRPRLSFYVLPHLVTIYSYYPYSRVMINRTNNLKQLTRYPGARGIGLHFELRAMKHIRDFLGNGTAKVDHSTSTKPRVEMLCKMGIAPNGASHTLDEHIELYERRIAEIEEKLKAREH